MDNKKKRQSDSTLSIVALIFFILDTFSFSNMWIIFFNVIPFGLVSLVLAIISNVKYKDTLSIVVIVLDVIKIVALLILVIFFWEYISNVIPEMPFYGGSKI